MIGLLQLVFGVMLAAWAQSPDDVEGRVPNVDLDRLHRGLAPPDAFWHGEVAWDLTPVEHLIDASWCKNGLGLSDEQLSATAAIQMKRWREVQMQVQLSREDRFGEVLDSLGQVFTNDQRCRFVACALYLEGPRALGYRPVAEQAGLTDEQRLRIAGIAERNQATYRPLARTLQSVRFEIARDPTALRRLIGTAAREERAILDLLTPKQREAWKAMIRDPQLAIPWFAFSSPSYSSDGRYLLFTFAWVNGHPMIGSLHLATRKTVRLTGYDTPSYVPRFSPDGRSIVFSSARDGFLGLYLMDRDGSNIRRLTDPDVVADEGASFAPDGARLVFGTRDSGIYEVRPDGSGLKRLHPVGHRPTYSPDGKSIMFQQAALTETSRPESSPLWLLEADGSVRELLMTGFDPVFLGDGKRIAFLDSTDPGMTILCVGDRDGRTGGLKKVTLAGDFLDLCAASGGRRVAFVSKTFRIPDQEGIQTMDLETQRVEGVPIR